MWPFHLFSIPFTDMLILMGIGIFCGFLSGLFGIGGASLMIPALIIVFGLKQHEAQATTLCVLLIPVTLPAFINYYKKGDIKIKNVLFTVVGFTLGGYLGSSLAISLSGFILKKIFGVFLLIMVAQYFFKVTKQTK